MAAQRLFHGFCPEILAKSDFTAIYPPVFVLLVVFPPGIYPVPSDRPAFAEIKLNTDVGNKQCIIKQVGSQPHVKRLCSGNGNPYSIPDDHIPFNRVPDNNRISHLRGITGETVLVPAPPDRGVKSQTTTDALRNSEKKCCDI